MCASGCVSGYASGCVSGYTSGWVGGWVSGCVSGCIYVVGTWQDVEETSQGGGVWSVPVCMITYACCMYVHMYIRM